jgi:23S rRNA (uracil1939-C5)-methyltransferase
VVVVPSPDPYGYRGRARLWVHRGRPGYRAAGSRRHVPVTACPVLALPLQDALGDLAAARAEDGEWELALGRPDREHPDGVRRTHLVPGAEAGPLLELAGPDGTVRIAPGGFAQANPLLFAPLIEAVATAAGSGSRLLELYAGAGFFTLALARRFARVLAVEAAGAAVAALRDAARGAGLGGVEAVRSEVEPFLATARRVPGSPEVIVADPPRRGLGPAVVEACCRPPARRFVYLSCDPATLARDLASLRAGGWSLGSVRAFDLFPQTPHVETLAVLERGERAR